MAVLQIFRAVRTVEEARGRAGRACHAVLPDDLLRPADFDHALVALVRDQDVAIGQHHGANRRIELVCIRSGHASHAILPDDGAAWVDQNHPVIRGAIGMRGFGACGCTRAANERKVVIPPDIVRRNHGMRPRNARPISKCPRDLHCCRDDFNNPVVELIGN